MGIAEEPVLLPLQPSVKHRGVNINFIIKPKTSLDFCFIRNEKILREFLSLDATVSSELLG